MKNLEDQIKEILSAKGLTIQRLAVASKISEPTLHAIFNRNDAKLSQLQKIAEALETPLSLFLDKEEAITGSLTQTGFANISGSGNKQKIMPGADSTGHTTSLANTVDLASKLNECQQMNQALTRELEITRELVKSKDDMIALLRGSRDRPN